VEGRRERQERLSGAMGQLLLRGYRMLGQCCPQCGTILLQDKQRRLLCVCCQELDADGNSPSTDRGGALGGRGGQMGALGELRGGWVASPDPEASPSSRPEVCEGAASGLRGGPPSAPPPAGDELVRALVAARAAVVAKLGWAAQELPRTSSAEASAQLCSLVRACADALGGLQALE
ncbi:SSA27 protein, partial [Rhinopomastus cyanomelas]|nr:SSA27 protein [Rhinopomastus cyanomelas]